jgi:hypothetical protein
MRPRNIVSRKNRDGAETSSVLRQNDALSRLRFRPPFPAVKLTQAAEIRSGENEDIHAK